MAGFFQQFLRGAADGFLGSPYMRDYKHAAKTFLPNAYQNAPKFKWLFHTYFEINPVILNTFRLPLNSNFGLLVKSIDLPKYQFSVQELNQYNRKRYVQTKINYEPARITFHDDNANQIRNLYYTYYSYYYNDPSRPLDSNTPQSSSVKLGLKNYYDDEIDPSVKAWGYNGSPTTTDLRSGYKYPFFKSIKIYGFNQHNFSLYMLVNPIITDFSHDTYMYATSTETMECSMAVKYETVKYYEGAMDGQDPSRIVEKFGSVENYDTDLSPINTPGTNKSILGQGGLVDSAGGIINDLSSGNILGALQTAGRLGRTFKNPQNILQTAKTELVAGAISAASNPQNIRSVFNFPAQGSSAGNGGQQGNATNTPNVNAPAVSVPSNTPASGIRPGAI